MPELIKLDFKNPPKKTKNTYKKLDDYEKLCVLSISPIFKEDNKEIYFLLDSIIEWELKFQEFNKKIESIENLKQAYGIKCGVIPYIKNKIFNQFLKKYDIHDIEMFIKFINKLRINNIIPLREDFDNSPFEILKYEFPTYDFFDTDNYLCVKIRPFATETDFKNLYIQFKEFKEFAYKKTAKPIDHIDLKIKVFCRHYSPYYYYYGSDRKIKMKVENFKDIHDFRSDDLIRKWKKEILDYVIGLENYADIFNKII